MNVIVTGLVRGISSFAAPIAQGLMERNDAIIRLRKKFGLDREHLPDEFGVVYQYTLIEYGVGKEESLLGLFEQKEIQEAFRREFEQNQPSALENAVEELVNWECFDWNTLGRNIKELDVNLGQEIEDFRKAFYKVLPLTFTPSQVQHNKNILEILERIEKLDELNEVFKLLKEALKLIRNIHDRKDLIPQNLSPIDARLEETLKLYLEQCFRDDKAAKLEQAGEKDADSKAYLVNLFIDLDVKVRPGARPKFLQQESFERSEIQSVLLSGSFSVMNALLQEYYSKIVIIGIAGQGKSTLSQQLAQIHRANLLAQDYDEKFKPRIPRIPFKVILKDFAQWLANEPEIDALVAYLAERVGKLAKRPEEVTTSQIQEILRNRDCLLILDGLDEVAVSKIQQQMLERIQDFLADAESLNAKVMVVATSRPNDYNNQFDPEKFWHLELDLLKREKVKEYTEKWLKVKEVSEDDACKIIPTIEECQDDPSVNGLLTTPLQVTIILIIIKGGRKPPSQREDLFNEYWLTIYRREEGKDQGKNIIKNNESHLLDLHAYIGYILHRRAADQNIKSLLSKSEFKNEVGNFLRKKKGEKTLEEDITSEIEQLVKEVGDRLVLIFQKETDFYGFDLRSFQEFFAAVHLTKQAKNTEQRFDRLATIASYGHWRNVALFSAGRIARTFTGELSNLVQLWRKIDRDGINRYLKPGSWLALEIAADSLLTDHYDTQYSAIEDGLKVLDTGLTPKEKHDLKSLLERLSNKHKQQILRPVLEGEIRNSADTCLLNVLSIYISLFEIDLLILDKIDLLLQSKREYLVNSALDLALNSKLDSRWIAERLKNHWSYSVDKLLELFVIDFNYFKSILDSGLFTEKQLKQLVEFSEKNQFNYHFRQFAITVFNHHEEVKKKEITLIEPNTLVEQIILTLQCYRIIIKKTIFKESTNKIEIYKKDDCEISLGLKLKMHCEKEYLIDQDDLNTLNKILKKSDLITELKFALWEIYFLSQNVDKKNLLHFLTDIKKARNNSLCLLENSNSNNYLCPFVSIFINRLKVIEMDTDDLYQFLETYIQNGKEIIQSIENHMTKLDDNKKLDFMCRLQIRYDLSGYLHDLEPLAERLRLSLEDLVKTYIYITRIISYRDINNFLRINDLTLFSCLNDVNLMSNPKILKKTLIYLTQNSQWMLTLDGYKKAADFLRSVIEQWMLITQNQTQSKIEELINLAITFLLKIIGSSKQEALISGDKNVTERELALKVFNLVSISRLLEIRGVYIENVIKEVPEHTLNTLKTWLDEKNETLFVGSAILWKFIIQSRERQQNKREGTHEININPEITKRLISEDRNKLRQLGTVLLTCTKYPIEDRESKNQLLVGCRNALSQDEERAWSEMLSKIAIVDDKKQLWSSFLEDILDNPRDYGTLILSAAMERYQKINSAVNVTISEEDEKRLGLP